MKVAIAHEWMTSYAGSERVVEQLTMAFPHAEMITTIIDRDALPETLHATRATWLNRVPGARRHHEMLIPAMPLVWKSAKWRAVPDVVISSSHACAKAVPVPSTAVHVCYCHTPMRYAWDFQLERERFRPALRPLARAACRGLRAWDRRAAESVDLFIANSTAVADRITRFYERESAVVHPPVDTGFFTPGSEMRGDFFLFAGRLVAYKGARLAVEAFRGLDARLVVAGTGPLLDELAATATPNVAVLGFVSANRLRDLMRTATALVHPGEEDFGIAMAEAMACGCPVLAYRAGGAVDLVRPPINGQFFHESTVEALREAVRDFQPDAYDRRQISESVGPLAPDRFRDAMTEIVASVGASGAP